MSSVRGYRTHIKNGKKSSKKTLISSKNGTLKQVPFFALLDLSRVMIYNVSIKQLLNVCSVICEDDMGKFVAVTACVLLALIALILLVVAGYVCYVGLTYERIPDNTALEIENNQSGTVALGVEYSIATYNVGFGAYNHEFSFFMDSGKMKDGTEVTGKNSKAASEEVVKTNINGSAALISEGDYDFILLQEVDLDSTRSYHINQYEIFNAAFSDMTRTYGICYDSAFLFYPLTDPHGKSLTALASYSKFKMDSALRRQYPLATDVSKYFDLDRCFVVMRYSLENGKELVVVNSHMSAYDKGGIVRHQQLEVLNAFLADEQKKGNYVIVGGDFNHDIAHSDGMFESQQFRPEWVYSLSSDDLVTGYQFVAAQNAPTCRSTDIPYEKGVNYTVVLDGFIVSNNIEVKEVVNIDNDFIYSDHNPATMTFVLK